MKKRTLRSLVPALLLIAAVVGLGFKTGWGTISSFGIDTIAAVCPLGAVEVFIASGHPALAAVVALGIFIVLTVVFGRIFCGWVCPVPLVKRIAGKGDEKASDTREGTGTAGVENKEEISGKTNNSSNASDSAGCTCKAESCKDANASENRESHQKMMQSESQESESKGPYIVLGGALAGTAVFGFPVFCLVCPLGLTFALVISLWRLFEFNEPLWSALFFAAFLVLELFVLRKWCHKFCPIGAFISLIARFNRTFRPSVDKTSCLHAAHGVDCHACTKACPEGIDLKKAVPAGLASRCTKCGECAAACPSKAISFPVLPKFLKAMNRAPAKRIEISSETPEIAAKKVITLEEAVKESSRCVACGECSRACPQGNPVGEWMRMVASGDIEKAAKSMAERGTMPEICSRLCPHEKLCEGACSMDRAGGAVAISLVNRAIADVVLANEAKARKSGSRAKKHVSVIGSGPAGLSCAQHLADAGIAVTVYEADSVAGGLLGNGIPEFKLDSDVVEKRLNVYRRKGIAFELGCEVGKDVDFKEIFEKSDAVFLGLGARVAKMGELKKKAHGGVFDAMSWLRIADDGLPANRSAALILGGGDTAIDCARSAVRKGFEKVTVVYRSGRERMRAGAKEIAAAAAEGVEFMFGATLEDVVRDDAGMVVGAKILCNGTAETVGCGAVIVAFGFECEAPAWLAGYVEFDANNRILVNGKLPLQCANEKVFAGGDAVRGADLVVTAVADGKAAAASIVQMLESAGRGSNRRRRG